MRIIEQPNMRTLKFNRLCIAFVLTPFLAVAQFDTARVYEELERNFCAKRLFDDAEDLSIKGVRNWESYLDTNSFYAVGFKELKDTLAVFENELMLFRYKGFRTVLHRLSPSETKQNYGIPYFIQGGKPFEGYERYMDDGIIGIDTVTDNIYFISGALFLDDEMLIPFLLKSADGSDFMKYRFYNYRPVDIIKRDDCYYFYSERTGKNYRCCPSGDSFFAPLEEL